MKECGLVPVIIESQGITLRSKDSIFTRMNDNTTHVCLVPRQFWQLENHFKLYFPSQHLTCLYLVRFLHLSFSLTALKFSGKKRQ